MLQACSCIREMKCQHVFDHYLMLALAALLLTMGECRRPGATLMGYLFAVTAVAHLSAKRCLSYRLHAGAQLKYCNAGAHAASPTCDTNSNGSPLQQEDCILAASYLRSLGPDAMCGPGASGCSGMVHINSCAANICGSGGGILCSAAANYIDAAFITCADSDGTFPSAQVAVTENRNLTIILTQPYASYAPGSVG